MTRGEPLHLRNATLSDTDSRQGRIAAPRLTLRYNLSYLLAQSNYITNATQLNCTRYSTARLHASVCDRSSETTRRGVSNRRCHRSASTCGAGREASSRGGWPADMSTSDPPMCPIHISVRPSTPALSPHVARCLRSGIRLRVPPCP